MKLSELKVGQKVLVEAIVAELPERGTLGWKTQMIVVRIDAPGGEHGIYGGGKACVPPTLLHKESK